MTFEEAIAYLLAFDLVRRMSLIANNQRLAYEALEAQKMFAWLVLAWIDISKFW